MTPIDDHAAVRLQAIGLTPELRQRIDIDPLLRALSATAPFLRRVTEVQRDALTLHDGEAEAPARAWPGLRARGEPPAVGDWVLAARDRHGQWWVHARVPPTTQLARRLHDGREKATRTVIVSNVDTALLVMGLDHDWNLRRLERYLALARLSALQAVVVLTKVDLCPPELAAARLQAVRALLPPGVQALALNALDDGAAAALARWAQPMRTLVLLGSSGAGKSTLTNALLGASVQAVGPSRVHDGRGRHTTTARSLHVLPRGACVIDTPGLRTLRLDADAQTLAGVFDDIATLAQTCRFRDCRHQDEPGCAVRDATDAGRLRNFHKLQREARLDTMSALERREQRQRWKVRHKAARARDRAGREPG